MQKKEFNLLIKCRDLYADCCKYYGEIKNANSAFAVVLSDIRDPLKELVYKVRAANNLETGSEKRNLFQLQAVECLEEIIDLLSIEILSSSEAFKALLGKSGEIMPSLKKWIISDQKELAEKKRARMREAGLKLYNAKKDLKEVEAFKETHRDERTADAYDEAKARVRILSNIYQTTVQEYDAALKEQGKSETLEGILREIRGKKAG